MNSKKIVFFIKLFTYIFIILFITTFISNYFSDRVKTYIKQKATLESSMIIASAIEREVLSNIDLDNLIITVKSENENIDSIYINTYQVNNILALTTSSITSQLNNLENQDLEQLTLPLGIILSDVLFYDLGPEIKIKLYPVGAVKCDVKSVIEEYGINNSIFRLEIDVSVSFAVVVPLQREEIEVNTAIPVVVQIIQGEVPRFYFSSKDGKILP